MKYSYEGINSLTYIIGLTFSTLALLFILPVAWAEDFTTLKGCWECQEDGGKSTLEFKSRQQLLYNGKAYNYRIAPGTIKVQEGSDLVDYFFAMEGNVLVILPPDGSVMRCYKTKISKQAATKQKSGKSTAQYPKTGAADQHWPPPYARPQGRIDEQNPGSQALLYKFAGRWDHVTRNTLTNLFLKPDGTYEEAYEAGYSGVFQDQGGYQTGNWGATGSQQARGNWKAVGSLRQGKLYLVNQAGRKSVISYQVHIRRGEVFWGEYFFNGKLYSVNYIYR
ncbi:MAG: hypothetical protein ABIJ37_08070 [Pseudomonadota bacterium]